MAKVHIYGCGGMGTNVVSIYRNAEQEPNMPELAVSFIDTSLSNLSKHGISESEACVLDGLDGSGKLRKENANVISDNIKQILLNRKPGDFNIVVFSASGGSGSVAAPLIMKELLSRKIPVVGVMVGSQESLITTQNTINTFKSLDAIARQVEQPVVVFYRHMESLKDRSKMDTEVRGAIGYLTFMNASSIHELDRMDINNWLFYPRVTSQGPTLTSLEIFNEDAGAWGTKSPITVLTLCTSTDHAHSSVTPEYQCCGYVAESALEQTRSHAIHFVTDAEYIRRQIKDVQVRLDDMIAQRDSRISPNALVSKDDSIHGSGLVL